MKNCQKLLPFVRIGDSLIFVILFLLSSQICLVYSQTYNLKTPKEYVDLQKLNELEKSNRSSNDPQLIDNSINEYKKILEEYYSQYPEDRRTEEERSRTGNFLDSKKDVTAQYKNKSGKVPSASSYNFIRVFDKNRSSVPSSTFTIRDSETLYRIYAGLGKLYKNKNDIPHALNNYYSAFRFRNFSNNEEDLFSDDFQKENIEPSIIESINSHKKKYLEKIDKEKELNKFIDDFHISQAKKAKQNEKIDDEKTFKDKVESLKKELDQKTEDYKKSYNEVFLPIKKIRNRLDSENLMEYANLVSQLEIEERKIRTLSSPYPLHDPDKEKPLNGTTEILEFAHSLDSENAEVAKLLGDIYRSGRNKDRAMQYYKEFLNAPQERKKADEENEVHLALGGLYSSNRNYIKATEHYEKFVINQKDNNLANNDIYSFTLGEIFHKRLGDFKKSNEYFRKWLDSTNKSDGLSTQKISDFIDVQKKKMIAYVYLSEGARFFINREGEEEYLILANKEFSLILQRKKDFIDEYSKLEQQVDALKKQLLYSTDSLVLETYKEEKRKLDSMKFNLDKINMEISTLPTVFLYKRLSQIQEDKKDLNRTIEYLKLIQEFGTEQDKILALKNIIRVESILRDGIYRERIEE
jgi:tetratricopeptide (TPR) repeat protein